MQIILILLTLFSFEALADGPLKTKIDQLSELSTMVQRRCLRGNNSAEFKVEVSGKSYSCQELIIVTDRLREQLEPEIDKLEACEQESNAPEVNRLAPQALAIANMAGSCQKKSTDTMCFGQLGCSILALAGPLNTLLASASSMAGAKNQCVSQGYKGATSCLTSLVKGIIDGLWGTLKLLWNVVKAPFIKAAELLHIVKKSEKDTSERAMAAQQAGPGFIERFVKNPILTIKNMASSLYRGLKASAQQSYGCKRWSGAQYLSTCLEPMTDWDCATCEQKIAVWCGVGGVALSEIGTGLLTGGVFAGAKAVATASLKGVRVAARAGRLSPKAQAAISAIPAGAKGLAMAQRAARASLSIGAKGLSAAQRKALSSWRALSSNPATRAIGTAADKFSKTRAGAVTKIALMPATAYLNAIESATALGFRSVDNVVASAATKEAKASRLAQTGAEAPAPTASDDLINDIPASNNSSPNDATRLIAIRHESAGRTMEGGLIMSATGDVEATTQIIGKAIDLGQVSPAEALIQIRNRISTSPIEGLERQTLEQVARRLEARPNPIDVPDLTAIPRRRRVLSNQELQVADKWTLDERYARGREVLARELTEIERNAIREAHEIGIERGFGKYELRDIRAKRERLTEANFSPLEIRALMEQGVAGGFGRSLNPSLDNVLGDIGGSEARVAAMRARQVNANLQNLSNTPEARARIPQLIAENISEHSRAGQGLAREAASSGNPQHIAESWKNFAAAGDVESTVNMMRQGVQQGGMKADLIIRGNQAIISRLKTELRAGSNVNFERELRTLEDAQRTFQKEFPSTTPSADPIAANPVKPQPSLTVSDRPAPTITPAQVTPVPNPAGIERKAASSPVEASKASAQAVASAKPWPSEVHSAMTSAEKVIAEQAIRNAKAALLNSVKSDGEVAIAMAKRTQDLTVWDATGRRAEFVDGMRSLFFNKDLTPTGTLAHQKNTLRLLETVKDSYRANAGTGSINQFNRMESNLRDSINKLENQ